MVLEHEILPYFEWLFRGADGTFGALPRFLLVLLAVALLGLVFGYIFAAARKGFLRGGDQVFGTVTTGFRELLDISPRRIFALTRLAMKEAWRRRVVVALVVYFVILLFASWFLRTDHQEPAKLFLSFVLMATTYLVLGISLVLSAFSLPNDFKTKTIYTVVTKPVRAGEIILGRILGFSLVGTILLVVMGFFSYIFVVRSLDHRHSVEDGSLSRIYESDGTVIGQEGRTSLGGHHRHTVEINTDGLGETALNNGHFHLVDPEGDGYQVGAPEGFIRARVPRWGKLQFLDRKGEPKARGISVGTEWTYRTFIDGGTRASAIWTFTDVDESMGKDGLPLGLITRVFRTHKGIIGKPIPGTLQLRNPKTELKSDPIPFDAKDAQVQDQFIEREQIDTDGNPIDLYDDLVSDDGQLEILIQCMPRGQYFGYAQADCYIRMPDGSPLWNYTKAYISIWVQMVIVTSIGVAASALLSGPVAMLFTVSFILLGFFRDFFVAIAEGTSYGGGPVESLYRIVTQKNIITPLDPGTYATVIQSVDWVLKAFMWAVAQLLPDFSALSSTNFVAYGYNIPGDQIAQDLTTCLAYVVGMAVLGYFLLRTREVAR